jgi:hypothetical protein
MPVEECGNMLILTGAICQIEGKADYALKHWDVLTTWTDYLVEHGGDPENQLCTDDFAGHWARNANLAIKAIEGIAAYGDLAKMAGKNDIAQKYTAKAKEMAAAWKQMAEQGDHYRLTFNEGDTWSQKYNLVWDKILGYNVFDEDIAAKEINQTFYVCGVYEVDGQRCSTGVIAYSLGQYCKNLAGKDASSMQALAAATAVYGYYADNYFA